MGLALRDQECPSVEVRMVKTPFAIQEKPLVPVWAHRIQVQPAEYWQQQAFSRLQEPLQQQGPQIDLWPS